MVPLLLYTAVSAFMIWRASKNYHVVLALVLNDIYYVETASSKTGSGHGAGCSWLHQSTFILWPPVREFLTGHLWLRLRYGLRETEVIFRTPLGREYDSVMALPPHLFQQALQMSLLQATSPLRKT